MKPFALLFMVGSLMADAQPAARPPEFEVASIRASAATPPDQVSVGLHIDGAQVQFTYLTLKDYLAMAYGLKGNQILGPDWITSARFDIAAKLPEATRPGQLLEMLKTLLLDRFQMKVHQDAKEFPVYVLEVAKGGLKFKESPPDAEADGRDARREPFNMAVKGTGAGVSVDLGKGSYYTFSNNHFEARKLTMASFTDTLERFVDRHVVDKTGLAGRYDLDFDVSEEDYRVMMIRGAVNSGVVMPPQALRLLDVPSGDSLMSALEKLGLTLAARKAPLDVLVVDESRKTPTDN